MYENGPVSDLAAALLRRKDQEYDGSTAATRSALARMQSDKNAQLDYFYKLRSKMDDIGLKNNNNPYAYTDVTAKFGNPFY